jgi:hypothetical protein
MVKLISPNRAVVFAVAAFVVYWIAALFVPALILRDIFNALAFGSAVMIVLTWGSAAVSAVRAGAESGEWQLVLAIFLLWFVVLFQRTYAVTFNWYGRPDSWAESPIAGFWPYSYTIAGLLFIAAPGVNGQGIRIRTIWSIIAAVGIGSLIAGFLIGASISTG